jgi:hypothetical protein
VARWGDQTEVLFGRVVGERGAPLPVFPAKKQELEQIRPHIYLAQSSHGRLLDTNGVAALEQPLVVMKLLAVSKCTGQRAEGACLSRWRLVRRPL